MMARVQFVVSLHPFCGTHWREVTYQMQYHPIIRLQCVEKSDAQRNCNEEDLKHDRHQYVVTLPSLADQLSSCDEAAFGRGMLNFQRLGVPL